MAKSKISSKFKDQLSEKLMDLGNFVAIALVFGQLVSGMKVSIELMVFGILITAICYYVSYLISR